MARSRFEVFPRRLTVSVRPYTFDALEGPVSCWTFTSRRLSATGQKEIVFSIRRETGEGDGDYPPAALQLFRMFYGRAVSGHVVAAGALTILAPESPGLLDDPRLRGVVYGLPELTEPVPSSSIAAILLTQGEMDAALAFGSVRLLALLGLRSRYFPTAPWLERGRPDVASPERMAASLLSRSSRLRLTAGRAFIRGIETSRATLEQMGRLETSRVDFARREVVLEMSSAAAATVLEFCTQCGSNSAVTLLTCPDPHADGCLVWIPERRESTAITSPSATGTRLAVITSCSFQIRRANSSIRWRMASRFI